MKHTEGPWKFELFDDGDVNFILSHVSVDADPDGRLQDYGQSILEGALVSESDHEKRATARLIAAAPDLLLACELIKGWLDAEERIRCGPVVWIELCRAIAKAHGD